MDIYTIRKSDDKLDSLEKDLSWMLQTVTTLRQQANVTKSNKRKKKDNEIAATVSGGGGGGGQSLIDARFALYTAGCRLYTWIWQDVIRLDQVGVYGWTWLEKVSCMGILTANIIGNLPRPAAAAAARGEEKTNCGVELNLELCRRLDSGCVYEVKVWGYGIGPFQSEQTEKEDDGSGHPSCT